jgi:hypothetical protein
MSFLRLVACLISLSFACVGQVRDLTEYRKLGPLSFGNLDTMQQHVHRRALLVEFVDDCWVRRLKCQARAHYVSKEGDVTDVSYNVEPEKSGTWRIEVRLEQHLVDRLAIAKMRKPITTHETQAYVAYVVERELSHGDSGLVLKDKAGKIVIKI